MNTKIIFLALGVAALNSCSTAYKMGQTPDDVYFSPAKPQNEYVSAEPRQDRYLAPQGRNNYNNNSYDDFDAYRNDRFLRMSIGSPLRLSAFDNYYGYDGFSNWKYNNYAYNFNSPWNGYYYWNSFYNPYSTFNYYAPYYGYGFGSSGYSNVIISGSKSPAMPVSRPRAFSPGAYTNYNYSNSNLYLDRNSANVRPGSTNSNGRYNNSNSNQGTMRRIFSSPDNNSYYNNSNNANSRSNYSAPRTESYTPSRSVEAPTRSYTPSPSSSGSSGGSGGGGGVSRPGRGGN